MQTTFAQKLKASRQAALANNRIVTFNRDDLTKVSSYVDSKAKIPYTWYQTDLRVGIDISYTLDKKEHLKTTFESNKVVIEFPIDMGVFHLELDLNAQIVPEGSKSIAHLNRIQIQMEKKIKSNLWPRLQSSATAAPQQNHIPQYPTSNPKKKDWDKLARQIQIEAKKNKQDDEGANGLFKDIFASSDEKTRQAMIKSFQTSGGTVLSTDYKEVMSKDYEGRDRPSPPKGQQWRKY